MSCDQEASAKFVPIKFGTFVPGNFIQQGNQTTTPYQKGVKDVAQNNNTLWANIGHQKINDTKDDTHTFSVSSGVPVTFAYYKVRYPAYLPPSGSTGRRVLCVKVYATTTTGNWSITATTSTGSNTSTTYTGQQWAIVEVSCPRNIVDQLELVFNCDAASTATVQTVIAYVKEEVNTDITTTNTPYDPDTFIPVDLDHYDQDLPLSVVSIQHIQYNNEILYKSNKRAIVNKCIFANLGSSYSGTKGLANTYDTSYDCLLEYVYFPRQGTTEIEIYAIGHVPTWGSSGDTASFKVNIRDTDDVVNFVLSTGSSAFTSTWPCDGATLPVPQRPGPLFIEVWGKEQGKTAYLTALSILEK